MIIYPSWVPLPLLRSCTMLSADLHVWGRLIWQVYVFLFHQYGCLWTWWLTSVCKWLQRFSKYSTCPSRHAIKHLAFRTSCAGPEPSLSDLSMAMSYSFFEPPQIDQPILPCVQPSCATGTKLHDWALALTKMLCSFLEAKVTHSVLMVCPSALLSFQLHPLHPHSLSHFRVGYLLFDRMIHTIHVERDRDPS